MCRPDRSRSARTCPKLNRPRDCLQSATLVWLLIPMSFWRKIAGLAARNLDEAECDVCPPGLPGEDPAFSTAVTALGAKLAKADGDAQAGEYAAFSQVLPLDPARQR